jgi:hypothetical protein
MTRKVSRTFLLSRCAAAHRLCFLNHDILVQLLVSGESQGQFQHRVQLESAEDRLLLESCADIFDWLDATGRVRERSEILRTVVFPAVLSDFLHFLYEALETSRKGKLSVTFALLRKPLQEILFLLEIMLVDLDLFGKILAESPERLYSQTAGGIDVHTQRIIKVLQILDESDRFVAQYIARLRYDKSATDGFDGVCNKATHLFTQHEAIRTEPLNINFVFSDCEARESQWDYLYSRLPYLLTYARLVIERLCSSFAPTWPEYPREMERRISAAILLWAPTIPVGFRNENLSRFIDATRIRLGLTCKSAGFCEPEERDLMRIVADGAFPHEPRRAVRRRHHKFSNLAKLQGGDAEERPE